MSTHAYRKCAKCGATAIKDNTLRFHRFPKPGTTNILRATAWATYCWPDEDWSLVQSLTSLHLKCKVLCSRHFEDSCYTDSSKKQLSRYAVPGTKEYIVKTLRLLRSKLQVSSIVQQVLPVAGCSSDTPLPVGSVTGQSTITVNPSQGFPVAGCSAAAVSRPEALPILSGAELSIEMVNSSQDDAKTGNPIHRDTPLNLTEPSILSDTTQAESSTQQDKTVIKKVQKKRKGILQCLNKNKISDLTTTEKKLYTICTNKIKLIRKLKKTIKGKAKLDKVKKICEDENVRKLFDLKLSNPFIVLLQSQLTNSSRKQKGRRYNLEQKLQALTLYKKSPACYRVLRRMFSLPCQSTLNKLLNKVPMKPGINEHVFKSLQAMAESQTEEENLCTLLFDEMAIRKHLNYNMKSDSVDGFQDHGKHGRTQDIACNALVFMVSGLRKKWKQPVAFYLSAKSVTSDRLSVIIKEILSQCFKVGLNVLATVCDLSSVNTKALHKLGSTAETPYFIHEGKEIINIADPPHLLKCMRNMLIAHDIEFPMDTHVNGNFVKGIAKWQHLKQFYVLDNCNPNFVYAPALTEKHVNPNAKQKMRVKLAAQVFSHTVAAGMLAKIATGELPTEALATATLFKNVDQLFDSLNSNSQDLRRGKKFSTNLTLHTPHLKYLKEMKKMIKEMKFIGARCTPPSQIGWVQTINAVERLWRNVTAMGIQSLSTRRLNQDPLENLFGCVRYNCGSNYNPTISQFIGGFKTAIITNIKQTSKIRNCEDDDGVLCNNLKNFLMSSTGQRETKFHDEEYYVNYDRDINESEIQTISSEIQACAYVCGFIIKKLNLKCKDCINLLSAVPGSEPAHLFTEFKENVDNKQSLNYASQHLIMAVEKVATMTNVYLTENVHKENLTRLGVLKVTSKCKQDFAFLQKCPMHYEKNLYDILHHIFYITMKRFIVLKNRILSEEATAKALERKLKILRNT